MSYALLAGRQLRPTMLWPLLLVYLLLLTGLYASTAEYLWLQWQLPDYSYCMLLPLIVAYLVWDRWGQLSATELGSSLYGLLPILLGLALYWLGELGGEYYSLFVSFWLILVGLCLLHLGVAMVKELIFPLLMIIPMFPLPNIITVQISLQLKLISSQLGVAMLRLYGMSAYREGNVIDLGFTQLQVVDACSGLRYLFPIIIMGVLLGYFYQLSYWKWALLVAVTVPVIVFNNGLRIAATGILYEIYGPVVAEGFFHDFAGWFTFMVALLLLLPLTLLLRRGGKREQRPADVANKPKGVAGKVSLLTVVLPVLLLSSSLAASQGIDFRPQIPLKKELSFFPISIGDWQGRNQTLETIYLDALDLSDYALINFRDSQQNRIDFYVAYYENQRKGESIHSPATCLPGGGWELKNSQVIELPVTGVAQPVKLIRTEMHMGDQRQLAYYWFYQRGRYLTNAVELKLYGFWDALTQKRTDGALVRLIASVKNGEDFAAAEARLQQFSNRVIPLLNQYIPGEKG